MWDYQWSGAEQEISYRLHHSALARNSAAMTAHLSTSRWVMPFVGPRKRSHALFCARPYYGIFKIEEIVKRKSEWNGRIFTRPRREKERQRNFKNPLAWGDAVRVLFWETLPRAQPLALNPLFAHLLSPHSIWMLRFSIKKVFVFVRQENRHINFKVTSSIVFYCSRSQIGFLGHLGWWHNMTMVFIFLVANVFRY